MTRSPTGDPATDALVAPLSRLVWSVHTGDRDEVEHRLTEAFGAARAHRLEWTALVVVLAGMVPVDQAPARSLGWHVDPAAFVRLVGRGVAPDQAIQAVLRRHNIEGS